MKEWYIFKGAHHIGPFTKEEMVELFSKGQVNLNSLVWKEGEEKWMSLSKISDFNFLLAQPKNQSAPHAGPKPPQLPAALRLSDIPPDPPNLPTSDAPPPLPIEVFQLKQKGVEKFSKQSELLQPTQSKIQEEALRISTSLNEEGKKSQITNVKIQTILFSSIGIIFLSLVAWYFWNEFKSSHQLKIKGLMPGHLEKLQEIVENRGPFFEMTMALSHDSSKFFVATNKGGSINALIKLRSIKRRIFSEGNVEIHIEGVINEHLGEFQKFKQIVGDRFYPGEYLIDFSGKKIHPINEMFPFLSSISFFKNLNSNYKYQTSTLVYSGPPREFEKKILDFFEFRKNENLKPLNEKYERLQTFLSLANKTIEEYLLILENMNLPSEIQSYESFFIREISPILQSLVLEADEKLKQSTKQKEKAFFEKQIFVGKTLGEMAADMVTETAKKKRMSSNQKMKLRAKFEQVYKNLKGHIDNEMILIQEDIKKIQNPP